MRDILTKLDNILTESAVTQDVGEAKNAAQQAAIAISKKERNETPKNESFQIGDDFGISFSEDHEIATEIVDILEDGIVIDPFFGAGTTGVVALKHGRKYIGCELNPEYIEVAEKRLAPIHRQAENKKISAGIISNYFDF